MAGKSEEFVIKPGDEVHKGQPLVLMSDADVQMRKAEFEKKIDKFDKEVANLKSLLDSGDTKDRNQALRDYQKAISTRDINEDSLRNLLERIHADDRKPGGFDLICPLEEAKVLNYDFG